MSRLSLKSIGLSVLAAALCLSFTPNALATEFNGQVKVVPNPNAAPQITAKVDNAKLTELKLNELPDGAKDLGRMEGSKVITLELRLARTHVAQSAALALRRQVQDPTSPWYGKTLTPAEFAENFGLAGSDLDNLTDWLKAQGFEVGNVDNGRMVIGFSGTIAQVETAFHTEMHHYTAKDGSPRFAPATAPRIPFAFRAVVGHVAGLENFREYRAATFPGPVKDFIPGTMNRSLAETSGTSTPNHEGELLHDSSFTISSPAIGIGGHATLNVRLGGNTHAATGSLTIVDESTGDTVAHIADITTCTGYNGNYGRSCTVDFAPKGAGTAFLKAIYSGDENERGAMIGYNVISFVGTQGNYSTITISSAVSTYLWYSGAGNTTFASNIYYAGAAGTAATAATGTYSLDYYDYDNVETVIVNASNLTGCTTTTSTHNVSCSNAVSGSTLNTDSASQGYNQMDLVYSGDTNYASTSAAIFGYDGSGSSATLPTSIALNGSFTTTHTYGASASDSGLTGYTIVSPASPDAGYSTCQSIGELVGTAPVGELSAFLNGGSRTATSYTISFTEPGVDAIPAQLTPGTYPISTIYSGDKDTTFSSTYCTYGPLASTATVTLTEAKQTPTAAMTSPTAAAPTSQLAGSLSAFTVTGTLAWTGTGIAPTPGNLGFTSTAAGSFGTVTCTAANSSTTFPTSPYTCSATFTPTGTDSAGSYNINLAFTTDTNYAAAASTVTANYNITSPVTPTLALTPTTATSAFASTTPTPAITSTITGQASNGSSAGIVVTVTANATYGSLSTTNGASSGTSSVTCTTATTTSPNSACVVYFVPNGTTAVGTYSSVFSATSAASSNGLYKAVTTPATSNLQITQQTPTVAVTSVAPNTEVYGSSTTSTATATLSWVGGGAIPTGATLTFTSSAGGTFTGESCSGSSSPITCTATFTPTGTDAVGSYYIEATYAGDTNYATANSGTTNNYTITKQTPTFGTMSFSPAASEPYGTPQIVSISDTLIYAGTGNAPTGAVKYVLNAVSYTATCTGSSSPLTCTASVPAATIAALAINAYTVTAAYTTDTNYAAATGASGTFTITQGMFSTVQMTTSAYATPPTATTQGYGTVTPFSVYATFSPSGTIAPTGADVVFATSTAGIGTFGTATCTVVSGVARCTAVFTPNGTAVPGSYNINVSFSGDTNYGAAGPSTNGTGLYVVTNATPTLTFNPSPITSVFGSTSPITVTVTASNGDTGTVHFTGSYATYGTLSATSCVITATSCSVTFTPNGGTAIGSYANILTADLPASGFYNDATANDSLTISKQTTYLAMTVTPIGYFDAVTPGAHTVVLSWTNPALEPTGTILISSTTASRNIGTITLSPTGAAIAAGTACTTAGSIGTCTYSCAAKVDLAVSCVVTNTATSGKATATVVADVADGNAMLATYSGDGNFAGGTANTYLYNQSSYAASGGQATIALTGTAIANATYGLTQAEGPTVSITGSSSDAPSDSTFPFLDITSTGATGTMYEINLQTCTTNPCVTATSWNFPAVVAPGTYSLSYNYSGDYQSSAGETDQTTLTSGSIVVAKGTTTLGTMSFSPASSEPYGTSQAITISAPLTYLGVGEAPQGAVTFTLNSVAYTATCALTGVSGSGNSQSNVETCSATVSGAVIAALPAAAYTVTSGYTTDTNYLAATGTSGTFTITQATETLTMVAGTPGTTTAGVATTTLVATLSPAVTGSTVTFTDVTTGATIGTATTNSMGVATITVNTAGTGSGQSSKPSGGKNLFSASATSTANTLAASTTSNAAVYVQGILFAYIGTHNFSGLLTGGNNPYTCCTAGVEGTVDGTTAGAYGVSVYNFTGATAALPVTLTNSAAKAFSLNNECGATLGIGETCTLVFSYAPPAGDGCTPALPVTGGSCTLDGSGYPQGTYESGTWTYTLPSGVLSGLGNPTFTTSGVVAASGTVAGKALLNPLSLSVSPLTAAFGTVAQNATSQTITISVQNTNMAAVPFTYVAPTSGHFTANNSCASPLAANSSCSIYLTAVTTTTGTFSDSLSITPSGGAASTVAISDTVAAGSTGITLSSNSHSFGSVTDGTSANFSMTLTNNTGSAAMLSFSNSAGTGYTTSTNCGASLAASATCNYGFTFAPTTPGAANDTLTITSSVPILPGGTGSGPYTGTVTVSGTGVAGGHLTATSVTHNFGSLAIGTSGGNYGVEITNSTSAAVTLSYSGLTGGANGFSVVGTTCGASLAINQNCELVFTFTPTAAGFVTGTYPITSSSPLYAGGNQVSPSQITLQGTGN